MLWNRPFMNYFGFEWVEKYFEVAPGIRGVLLYAFAAKAAPIGDCAGF